MTPERWRQVEELYWAVRALPPSERTALLQRADPELRATVASILAQEGVLEKGTPTRKKARSSIVQCGRVERAF